MVRRNAPVLFIDCSSERSKPGALRTGRQAAERDRDVQAVAEVEDDSWRNQAANLLDQLSNLDG